MFSCSNQFLYYSMYTEIEIHTYSIQLPLVFCEAALQFESFTSHCGFLGCDTCNLHLQGQSEYYIFLQNAGIQIQH
jgi:hypothetical protein